MNMSPKVLVGAPVSDMHEYCFDEFIGSIKSLTYPNYDILLVDNSKTNTFYEKIKKLNIPATRIDYEKRARERVTKAHNLLREKALKENYDYLLLLDQDVIPPINIIEKLTSHQKDVVAGLYFGHHILPNGENRVMPFAWKFKHQENDWNHTRYLNDDEVWNPSLVRIAFAGGGCILISKSILEKIKFRYDENIEAWDDRWLGYDLSQLNVPWYLDNTVKCNHLYLNRPFSWQDIAKKGEN